MNDEKEMTALSTSVGADDGQSLNAIGSTTPTDAITVKIRDWRAITSI